MQILIKRAYTTILTVNPLTSSDYSRALMGENQVTLVWEQPSYTALQVGDYITHDGTKFTLNQLPTVKKLSAKLWQYNAVFQSPIYDLLKVAYMLFDNTGTIPQSEFSLTGTPETFMLLLTDNLSRVLGDFTWSQGQILEAEAKTITFSNENCHQVLTRLANEFETEYSLTGNAINLIEITNISNLTLEYGSTLYDIERKSIDSSSIITRLYPFGSSKNIDSNYRGGSQKLLLPDPLQFLESNVNLYGVIEGQKTFDTIYPRLGATAAGTVTAIGADIYTFTDNNLDFNVNNYLLPGTPAKLRFVSGQCAGYDLEIESFSNSTKTFKVIANEDDKGFKIPEGYLVPAIGDRYVLLDVIMPPSYVTAAEAELQAKAQEYLNENSHPKVSYAVTFSSLWAKQNAPDIKPGDLVNVVDADMGINTNLRVVKITKGVVDAYNIKVDLSETVSKSTLTRISAEIAANTAGITEVKKGINQNFSRNWRNVEELSSMIDTLRSDMLLIGSLQGQFSLSNVFFTPNYQNDKNKFYATSGSLVHKTIPNESTPGTWILPAYSPTLASDTTPYYLYAKCNRTNGTGVFYTSTTSIVYDSDATYYYFLVGVISSVTNGVRTLQTTYGFTQITGKQISTGTVQSNDGSTYFNLDTGEIGGNIKFKSGATYTEVGAGISTAVSNLKIGGRNYIAKKYLLDWNSISLNTTIPVNNNEYYLISQSQVYGIIGYNENNDVFQGKIIYKAGSQYSFKVRWKMQGSQSDLGMYFIFRYSDGTKYYLGIAGNQTSIIEQSYITDSEKTLVSIGSTYGDSTFKTCIYDIQLTEGNKQTSSYLIAPEDTDTAILVAKTAADTANALLADIASDNKLTPNEKQSVLKEFNAIDGEYYSIYSQADGFGCDFNDYQYYYAELLNYLFLGTEASPSILDNMSTTSVINGESFRSYFSNYYSARATTLADISYAAKNAGDSAMSVAQSASNAASNAQGAASAANSAIANITSDNVLSPVEKSAERNRWNQVVNEKYGIDTQAASFGITTEKTTYDNSIQTLGNYLNAGATWISPAIPFWLSDGQLSVNTTIIGSTYRSNWESFFTAKIALLNKIAAVAKASGDNAQTNLNNLKIGGRNYILNNKKYNLTAGVYGNIDISPKFLQDVNAGVTSFMLSFYASAVNYSEGRNQFYLAFMSGGVATEVYPSLSMGGTYSNKKYEIPITIPSGSYSSVSPLFIMLGSMTSLSVWDIQLEKGNKATDFTVAPEDNDAAIAEAKLKAAEADYLKTAIASDNTVINGGLMATTLLQMKNGSANNVTGGMSGLSSDNVGFWTGGTYQDAIDSASTPSKVAVIDRKDGSGHRAWGAILWNAAKKLIINTPNFKLSENGDVSIYGNLQQESKLYRVANGYQLEVDSYNIRIARTVGNYTEDIAISLYLNPNIKSGQVVNITINNAGTVNPHTLVTGKLTIFSDNMELYYGANHFPLVFLPGTFATISGIINRDAFEDGSLKYVLSVIGSNYCFPTVF